MNSQATTSSRCSQRAVAAGPGASPPERYFQALGLQAGATELEVILAHRALSGAARRRAATAYGILRSHFRRLARQGGETIRDGLLNAAATERCLRRLGVSSSAGAAGALDAALSEFESALSTDVDAERLVADARLAVLRLHAERAASEAMRGPRLRLPPDARGAAEHPQVVHYLELLALSGEVGFGELHEARRERFRELDADGEASDEDRERCRRELEHAFDVTRQVLMRRERSARARPSRRSSGAPASRASLLLRFSRLAALPLVLALGAMVHDDVRVAVVQYEVGEQLSVREDGTAFGEVLDHDPAHVFDGASEPVSAYRVRDAKTGSEQWVAEWFAESALRAG